ncbi:hypothetical protein GEOBRER4_n3553 [Citrifermentans bremense]|uniref:Fibronectin type-III domain-containing protein n=1 Tax=Citrifermentans bremense TaxID=60035 RepID=A0A6S6M2M8_9BACT|nr:hypothetical protein [Citrifermentans bremense]BCG48657.1 hypothetical protein GEOBRER4_n3553 [Citrifermentans bremense]
MGKIIRNKIHGMSWWTKTSLVLLFTLVTSVFMYQGWYKPIQAAAGVSYLGMSSATGTSTTLSVAAPAGLQVGDLMVISVTSRTTATTLPTMGSTGWTTLYPLTLRTTSTYRYSTSAYKVATSGDIGANFTVNCGTGTVAANIYAFRGVDPANPIDASSGKANTTASTTLSANTITTTSDNDTIVFLGQVSETTSVNFSNWATANIAAANWTAIDNTGTTSGSNGAAYAVKATAGAVGAGTATLSTSYINGGVLIALRPISIVNPTVTGLSTTSMAQGSGPSTVTITGTGFQNGATVDVSGTGVTAGTVSYVNATTLTVPVTVAADAAAGARTLTVTNPDTGFATTTFTVNNAPAPTVVSTAPAFMIQGAGPAMVTITGSNFQSGSTVAFSGTGITLGAVTYVDSTTLTVPVTVAVGATLGGRDVTVTLPGGVSGSGSALFTVNSPCAAGQPTALAHGTETTTSVPLTWTPGANTNYSIVFRDGVQIATNILTGSYTDNTAQPGTSYNYTVTGYNTAGSCQSAPSTATTAVTLAQAPVAPAVSNIGTGTQLSVAVNSDANSAAAQYAIRINGGAYTNQYIQSGGTIGATAAWLTKSGWGIKTISGLTSGTPYTFDVKARNGALVETGFGPSSTVTPKIALSSAITNCGGCHGNPPADGTGRNVPAGQFKGSHAKHTGIATCAACHKDNGVAPAGNKHSDGIIDIASPLRQIAGESYGQASHAVSETPTFASCTTYCHSQGTSKTSQSGESRTTLSAPATNLVWGTGTSTCTSCHASPPNYAAGTTTWGTAKANAHGGATHASKTCDYCHTSVTYSGGVYTTNAQHANGAYDIQPSFGYTYAATGGTCATSGCHGSVAWNGTLGCIDCHSSPITRKYGRPGVQLSAVKTEFGLTWGHKKSGRGAVTDADCIVCHLEGESATGKSSATYHQNGNIDLRDPDVQGESLITNIAGTASFTFQRFSTSFVSGSRTSSASVDTIANVITQKFCLKCHDADGAKNTTAWTAGGNAFMPFGGVNLGTDYSTANGAAAQGGLVNVAAQFALANSSKHPVLGPLNRDFPAATRMNVPYKPTGTRGTSGTLSQGVVINCFDCHNTPVTPLTLRTVTAHGNNNTLRGVPAVSGTAAAGTNESTLCKVCHAGYDTNTTADHGAGSAAGTSATFDKTEKLPYIRYGCNLCHSSKYASTVAAGAVRPVRAADVHGSNVVPTGVVTKLSGSRWAGTVNNGPIAFIRNSNQFSNHNPKKIGATTYTPQCMGGGSGSFSTCNRSSNETYAPGGTY